MLNPHDISSLCLTIERSINIIWANFRHFIFMSKYKYRINKFWLIKNYFNFNIDKKLYQFQIFWNTPKFRWEISSYFQFHDFRKFKSSSRPNLSRSIFVTWLKLNIFAGHFFCSSDCLIIYSSIKTIINLTLLLHCGQHHQIPLLLKA